MSTKLKIGLLTDNYPHCVDNGLVPGGIGTYTMLVAEELARLGHEAHVFTFSGTKRHRQRIINDVYVWECPAWSKRREMTPAQALEFTIRHHNDALMLSRYSMALGVQQAALPRRFDIIESPDVGAYGALIRGKRYTHRYAVRLHCSTHNLSDQGVEWSQGREVWDKIERPHALKADVLTAPTKYALDGSAAYWGCSLAQATIVGNPAVIPAATSTPETDRCSAVFFGRFAYQKGIDTLAQAIGLVKERHPHFRVTYIGSDAEWPLGGKATDHIRVIAEATGGEGSFRFLSPMQHSELQQEVRKHTVCVLPSRDETFGMAFLEAMMWHMPCVVSDIPPFRELAEDRQQCMFATANNARDFADKIIWLLSNPDCATQIAKSAHDHACGWSVERVVPELLNAWLN